MALRHHKHREMIGHIIDTMQDILNDPTVRPDEKVLLAKVKAHNAIIGNEIMDGIIAKAAAHRTQKIDATCPVPSEPSYASNYWPHQRSRSRTAHSATLASSTSDTIYTRTLHARQTQNGSLQKRQHIVPLLSIHQRGQQEGIPMSHEE